MGELFTDFGLPLHVQVCSSEKVTSPPPCDTHSLTSLQPKAPPPLLTRPDRRKERKTSRILTKALLFQNFDGRSSRRPLFRILSRDPVTFARQLKSKDCGGGIQSHLSRSPWLCRPVWVLCLDKNSQKSVLLSKESRTRSQNLFSGSWRNSCKRFCLLS